MDILRTSTMHFLAAADLHMLTPLEHSTIDIYGDSSMGTEGDCGKLFWTPLYT